LRNINEEHFMEKIKTQNPKSEQNVQSGQQGTKQPWKKPENSDHHPTKESAGPRPRRLKDNETS